MPLPSSLVPLGSLRWKGMPRFDLSPDQWGTDNETSNGLTYGYIGGSGVNEAGASIVIGNGTVALADAAVNYVERDQLGRVSVNQLGFGLAGIPMAKVTTAGGVVTALEDWRMRPSAAGLNLGQVTADAPGLQVVRLGDLSAVAAALDAGAVKVAFWGDSITEGLSNISYGDSWAGLVERALREQVISSRGPIAWTFQNLSLSGRGIGDANSPTYVGAAVENPGVTFFRAPQASNILPIANETLWPAGSTIGKTWYNHVRDATPDLLFIALGINDTSGDANAWAATLYQIVVNRIFTWAKIPSIVIVTPMQPTRFIAPWSGLQNEIAANAEAMRGFADEHNLTLVDVNRLMRAYREGVDVVRLRQRSVTGVADAGSWILAGGARPTLSPGVGATTMTFATTGVVLRPQLAMDVDITADIAVSGANAGAVWYRSKPGDPNKAYVVQIENATPQLVLYYNSVAIDAVALPAAATRRVHVVARGAHHVVYVDGVKYIDRFDYQRLYAGYYGFAVSTAGVINNVTARYGAARVLGFPQLSDSLILGPVDDYLTNENSLGGDMKVHPSALGHHLCYYGACAELIAHLRRQAQRIIAPMFSATGTATTGAIAAGDAVAISVNTIAGPSAMVVASTANTSFGVSVHAVISLPNHSAATCNLIVNSTVVATCTITLPYAGKWMVLAWGTVSSNAGTIRHGISAVAFRQQ